MKLEVGKTYVLQPPKRDAVVGRCICNDRTYKGVKYAVFLTADANGNETLAHALSDGSAMYTNSYFVVKEYTPPMKVRVVVIKDSRGNYHSFSATQKTTVFHDTGWPAYKSLPGYVLISDTIIEIEDKRGTA